MTSLRRFQFDRFAFKMDNIDRKSPTIVEKKLRISRGFWYEKE